MEIFHSMAETGGSLRGCAVAIGNFDGVHLAHLRLLEVARELAEKRGAQSALLTFVPHPAKVLAPEFAPPLISTLPRKIRLLERTGIGALILQPFDRELASTPPETFVRRELVENLGATDVVVGYDFTFGKGRKGTPQVLAELGGSDLAVHTVKPISQDGLVVGSSKIRELILEGRVAPAARLLGYPFLIDGVVVTGRGRGRKIGVPTANIAPETELLPASGVYAARAAVEGLEGSCAAAVNIGRKPTFGEEDLTVEVHLIDRELDVYGKRMAVALLERLRPEQRFASVEELVARIHQDIEEARAVASGAPALNFAPVLAPCRN